MPEWYLGESGDECAFGTAKGRADSIKKMKINTNKPYRIFAEVLEQEALNQFESAMQQPFTVRGALMPDAHAGYSLPIGAVVATDGVVLPSWVGYDIGCGMCAMKVPFSPEDVRANAQAIFDGIYRSVPVGFNHNQKITEWDECFDLQMTTAMRASFDRNGLKQLGSLGGGNHFIEIGEDADGSIWVIIHSGSRGVGHATAKRYMELASPDGKAREGHYGFRSDSQEGKDYITDLNFCLAFALENRKEIMRRVVREMAWHCDKGSTLPVDWTALINRNHNHAELKDGLWIHRKGATHAEDGMMGVIPGNMRDGSFIVRGIGNPDSLCSSSHGAGRVLSRKEAERKLDMEQFAEAMTGVVAKVDKSTLDESPFAYKDIFSVMMQQIDLVDVITHVRPIINIKG